MAFTQSPDHGIYANLAKLAHDRDGYAIFESALRNEAFKRGMIQSKSKPRAAAPEPVVDEQDPNDVAPLLSQRVDYHLFPSRKFLAERKATLRKQLDACAKNKIPKTDEMQYESLCLGFFTIMFKLEDISFSINRGEFQISGALADRVVARARSLHASARKMYAKINKALGANPDLLAAHGHPCLSPKPLASYVSNMKVISDKPFQTIVPTTLGKTRKKVNAKSWKR
jgi:hypothetical protein